MNYRGMTLNGFINQLMKVLEQRPVKYNARLSSDSDRLNARNRLMVEWYVQQPHALQNMIYESCMDITSQRDNIGPLGSLELVLMVVLSYG